MAYYYVFKFDHFNAGDKVYIAQEIIDEKDLAAFIAMRIVRPLTKADIDTLPSNTHFLFNGHFDPSLKPYVYNTGIYFCIDSMRKNRSGFIGTFIKSNIVYIKDMTGKYDVQTVLYAIKPNRKVFHEEEQKALYVPKNYINTDSTVYVIPFQISNKEVKVIH